MLSILIGLLMSFSILQAQSEISGIVLDEKGEALFFATVALYDLQDSSIVNAASTDDQGAFFMTDLKDGNYYLEASYIGYESFRKNLTIPSTENQSLEIKLGGDVAVLETVVVTGKTPLLEQLPDRLVVNLENNVISLNGSLQDVLKNVPGMILMNGELSLAGQANLTILINGKSTKYMDVQSLLQNMPGDNIKKVEIIHQPGAEFEAEGSGPIINIILKKNNFIGTNGAVNVGLGKGKFWKYNSSLSLSHFDNGVNLSGGISYSRPAWQDELIINRRVGDDVYSQQNLKPNKPNIFSSNLSLDWELNQQHNLGLNGSYVNSQNKRVEENSTRIDYADINETDLDLRTFNRVNNKWDLLSLNSYYNYKLDDKGQLLSLDANYTQFGNDELSNLLTEGETGSSEFPEQEYEQLGDTKIFAVKADYVLPLNNALKFTSGLKYSKADLNNNLGSFFLTESGLWEENLLQSNRFLFDEEIKAAYMKLDFASDTWNANVGLRFESSRSVGHSVTADSTVVRDINQLFPSLSVGRKITDKIGAAFAYSYRVDRPEYASLNSFVYYYDPFTYEQGNPNLAPTFTHSIKTSLTFEGQPFFNIEYKNSSDAIVEVTEQDDATGEAYNTAINLDSYELFSSSLYFPLDFIPKVSGFGGLILNHASYNSPYLEESFNRSQWSLTAFLQASIKLPWQMNAEVSGWYNSGEQSGIITGEWLYGVNAGIGKKLMDGKMRISLGVEDLFNRFWHGRVKFANMDANLISRWDTPTVNFKMTYKFGNQHLKEVEERKSSASDELDRIDK